MAKLEGYIDTATGHFCVSHKHMDIIIDLANGQVSERVSVPEYTGLEINSNAYNTIMLVMPEEQKWQLGDAPDKTNQFFYRSYAFKQYPTKEYMDSILGWFEWFFHKHDVYNVAGLPF